jgi:DNA-binding NarL/FixJ family response regulator
VHKLLILDDHPLYREGVASALAAPPLHARVVGAATISQALGALVREGDVELALIDRKLGTEDGLDALARIGAAHPGVVRVLVSGEESEELASAAARAGAQGFVPKSHSIERMIIAIGQLLDGGVYWPQIDEPPHRARRIAQEQAGHHLTLRQLEVLQLLSEGCSNAEIGTNLGITERTIKAHLQSIFEHLEVNSRVKALVRAQELGLLARPK